MENDCPFLIISCPYLSMGCNTKVCSLHFLVYTVVIIYLFICYFRVKVSLSGDSPL